MDNLNIYFGGDGQPLFLSNTITKPNYIKDLGAHLLRMRAIFIYWLGGLIVNQFQQKSNCLKQVSKFLHTDNLCFHSVPLFILFNFLHGGRGVCSAPMGGLIIEFE